MSTQPDLTRTPMAPGVVLGVATGLLVDLLTSLSPVTSIAAIVLIMVVTAVRLRGHADRSQTALLAGSVVGAGAFLSYGSVNTVVACINIDDFCGNANPWALGAFALATIAVGAIELALIATRKPG